MVVDPTFSGGFDLLLIGRGIFTQDGLGDHQEIHSSRERQQDITP